MSSVACEPVAVTPLAAREVAGGLRIAQLTAEALGASLDPFLMCDCFWMGQPFFPPHPHAGFSAVTYILPESAGGFVNRDSLGDRSLIRPGGLHWTEAARGMMHEEVPIEQGVVAQGFQIFVNLPAAKKHEPPRVYHLEPEDVPVWSGDGVSARVVVGHLNGVASPVQPRTACALWDVTLGPRAALPFALAPGWQVFGALTSGQLQGFSGGALSAVRFGDRPDDGRHAVRAGDAGARILLFSGLPLQEPIAFGGPFVMNTQDQLVDAKKRYALGEMGRLAPSF